VGEFLANIKREFRRGDNETMKVVELKKVEQGSKTIEEFIQEFRKAMRGSSYEERPLVEEFKREMNGVIRRKLIDIERLLRSIEQWYEQVTNLNRH